VSPVRYELGSYIPEDDILHSQPRNNLVTDENDLANSQILNRWKNCLSQVLNAHNVMFS
jgi:hypothetical protein